MQKLLIEDASTPQLAAFAGTLDLADVPNDRPGIIAKLIEAGYSNDFIFVAPEAPVGAPEALAEPLMQAMEGGEVPAEMPTSGFTHWTKSEPGKPPCPMVTLKVLSTERPGGNEPAHPIINNSPPLVIQRNKLVRIPWDFYEVLRQAGGTALLPNGDNKDFVRQDYREYPMEVAQMPTKAQVDAWREWDGQHELGRPKAPQQQQAA
jgi:hypothetical protein